MKKITQILSKLTPKEQRYVEKYFTRQGNKRVTKLKDDVAEVLVNLRIPWLNKLAEETVEKILDKKY